MNTKLTLNVDKEIIEKAKSFAKSRNTSLSSLIENYLQRITDENPVVRLKDEPNPTITPLVKSLSGIIDVPEGFDRKKAYVDHLADKYT